MSDDGDAAWRLVAKRDLEIASLRAALAEAEKARDGYLRIAHLNGDGLVETQDRLDAAKAIIAEAERERDEYRQCAQVEADLRREFLSRAERAEAALADEKKEHATTEDWVRVAGKSHKINMGLAIARAERAEADLAAVKADLAEAQEALRGCVEVIEFRAKERDPSWDGSATPSSVVGIARAFLERTK